MIKNPNPQFYLNVLQSRPACLISYDLYTKCYLNQHLLYVLHT